MGRADKQLIGSVEYHKAGQEYFDKRSLKRCTSSWALGVNSFAIQQSQRAGAQ